MNLLASLPSLQVRLILEFCDGGTLREALDRGVFKLPNGGVNYLAVLDTAADVCKGMLQLHALNVIHSDLKVSEFHPPFSPVIYSLFWSWPSCCCSVE
jgi:serine/threonine protein kinase